MWRWNTFARRSVRAASEQRGALAVRAAVDLILRLCDQSRRPLRANVEIFISELGSAPPYCRPCGSREVHAYRLPAILERFCDIRVSETDMIALWERKQFANPPAVQSSNAGATALGGQADGSACVRQVQSAGAGDISSGGMLVTYCSDADQSVNSEAVVARAPRVAGYDGYTMTHLQLLLVRKDDEIESHRLAAKRLRRHKRKDTARSKDLQAQLEETNHELAGSMSRAL